MIDRPLRSIPRLRGGGRDRDRSHQWQNQVRAVLRERRQREDREHSDGRRERVTRRAMPARRVHNQQTSNRHAARGEARYGATAGVIATIGADNPFEGPIFPDRRIDYILVGAPDVRGRGVVSTARLVFDEPAGDVFASDHFRRPRRDPGLTATPLRAVNVRCRAGSATEVPSRTGLARARLAARRRPVSDRHGPGATSSSRRARDRRS